MEKFAFRNIFLLCLLLAQFYAQAKKPENKFNVLVLAERGGDHEPYVKAGLEWIAVKSDELHFRYDVINKADQITDEFLTQYQLIVQLNFPPYTWKQDGMKAFESYIEEGKGGWIGFHHATLLGEFDGYPMWNWFSIFMGDIKFENYIASLVSGNVGVENMKHPVMKGVPENFVVEKEEWYTYNQSPRPNVTVLASVDENSYLPKSDIKMGDHPVVWTNEKMKARNVYIFMGHHPALFKNEAYLMIFENAIKWASKKTN